MTEPANQCVLLVEDEMCLAMMLQDLLEDAGYRVIKAARVSGAMKIAIGITTADEVMKVAPLA